MHGYCCTVVVIIQKTIARTAMRTASIATGMANTVTPPLHGRTLGQPSGRLKDDEPNVSENSIFEARQQESCMIVV